jgi:hypothetical protein
MKNHIVLCIACLMANVLWGQQVQTIKGTILDKDTREALIGASVLIKGTTLGGSTDVDGSFKITNVPVGRQTVVATYVGYNAFEAANIVVNSAKEIVLSIEMIESVEVMKEVVISGKPKGNEPINEMSLVSTRSFSVEETQRYAASANDPGRMATGFPGVQPSRDNRSDIVVRGNSGIGLGWRVEGIDVPNPNHFARIGSSGGGITIFSASMLANSDFSTGAFAAEYGNAISGVFDMKFRKGNTEKQEYTFRAGMLGLDFSTEGPFKKGGRASYLINYRYSTLGILNKVGLHLVGPRVDNTFQDLSFNINLPSKNNKHFFTIWGMGGLSREYESATKDTLKWTSFIDYKSYTFNTNMGAVGATHTAILPNDAYIKTSIAAMAQLITQQDDTLQKNSKRTNISDENYLEGRYSLSSFINKKFNARATLKAGFSVSNVFYDLNQAKLNPSGSGFYTLISTVNHPSFMLFEPYAQLRYRPSEKLTLNAGLHAVVLGLNNTYSVEPRASMRYQLTANQSLSLAYGKHSRVLPLGTYFYKNGTTTPNLDLPLLKSHQFVLAHELLLAKSMKIHTELYYQYHYDVAVNGTFSVLNTIGGFPNRTLKAVGTGTNYGVDIALEKAFEDGLFFMVSSSIFKSTYTDEAKLSHSTTFDSRFSANAMFGKEWTLRSGAVLQAGGRLIYNGGQRLTPIQQGVTINRYALEAPLDDTKPFTDQVAPYFRPDARIALRKNKKRAAYTLALDIQNVMNRKNIDALRREYNPDDNTWVYRPQSGLTPLLSFQIDF